MPAIIVDGDLEAKIDLLVSIVSSGFSNYGVIGGALGITSGSFGTVFLQGSIEVPRTGPNFLEGTINEFVIYELDLEALENGEGVQFSYPLEITDVSYSASALFDLVGRTDTQVFGQFDEAYFSGALSSNSWSVSGGVGNDVIVPNRFVSFGGRDSFSGGAGEDLINGGNGDDTLRGGRGDDTLVGGDGYDSIVGQRGSDRLEGGKHDDALKGGGGSDILFGQKGADFLKGGTVDDTLNGGAGNDRLYGNRGDDTLNGGSGDDKLNAGGGADVLNGGIGDDTLKGGDQSDIFVFSVDHGMDSVQDFDATDDNEVLDFSALSGFLDFADVSAAAQQIGDDVLITTSSNSSVFLEGVLLSDLDANDFIL